MPAAMSMIASSTSFSKVALKPCSSRPSGSRMVARCHGESEADAPAQFVKSLAAMSLAASISMGAIVAEPAHADVAGLTPCSQSAAFDKRQKKEIKGLMKRQKLYASDSAPFLALQSTIDKTNRRFDAYRKTSLLCGEDGLPHLIVDGDLKHLGEFTVPGLGFLYVAGYIGWIGRKYLQYAKQDKKPTEKEIILDIPAINGIMLSGLGWPLSALNELRNGELLEDDKNITVSPR